MATQAQQRSSSGLLSTLEKRARPAQTFLNKFANDWSMNFAGLIAYSLLMAMLPIAVALIAILGFILGSQSADAVIAQVTHLFPGLAGQQNAIKLATLQLKSSAGILALVAVLLAIFGGSRLFLTIEGCLDIIYRVRPRSFVQQNIMAFGMFLLFIILVPIMVVAGALPGVILSLLGNNPALDLIPFFHAVATNPGVTYIMSIIGGLVAAFILMEAIYFIVPNQRISWRNSWRGALVAAIAIELFFNLFPLYTQYFLKNYAGEIGFAVILLLFFYYFAVILMLGAEVNAFFFEEVRPLPNDLVTFISTMAGKMNRDIPSTESKTHQDAGPTDRADRAHVHKALEEGGHIQQKNEQEQQQIASKHLARINKKEKTKGTPKGATMLEVAAGTALAAIITWFQLRRQAK